jgi:hypothetical protein
MRQERNVSLPMKSRLFEGDKISTEALRRSVWIMDFHIFHYERIVNNARHMFSKPFKKYFYETVVGLRVKYTNNKTTSIYQHAV